MTTRFSQLYLEKGQPSQDSTRMRNRASAAYSGFLFNYSKDIVSLIHEETGAKVPFFVSSYSIPNFFEQSEIRDFLDSITLIFVHLNRVRQKDTANRWKSFMSRVFKEENLGYAIDDDGVVHYYVDEEFARSRSSTIAGLENHRAVKDLFEKAFSFLDSTPPDTSSAIKVMFEAVEVLYKHIISDEGKDRLNSRGVLSKIKPLLEATNQSNPTELTASNHLLDALCDWIDAGHMYRHGQKLDEPSTPSVDFTVYYLSQGANHIRFLLKIA